MSLNLLTAIALALAGFTLGTRQIVLSPRNDTFPCAPESVRLAMFISSCSLAGLAVLFWGKPEPFAGDAAAPVAVIAGVLALYNVVMLVNLLAQRYSRGVWPRIERAQNMVKRSRGYRPGVGSAQAEREQRIH